MLTLRRRLRSLGRSTPAFLLNFASFIAVSATFFHLNRARLLDGLDGALFLTLARNQFQWATFDLGFTNDVLRSNGNISFPVNMFLIPGYAVPAFIGHGDVNRTAVYLIFASEIFLATFLLSRTLRLSLCTGLLAAWAMPLLCLPYVNWPFVYVIYVLSPHLGTAVAEAILILALFSRIGRGGAWSSSACTVGLFTTIAHLILAQPSITILAAPMLLAYGATCLLAATAPRELVLKVSVACLTLLGLVALGFAAFELGLFRYTAANFFAREMVNDRAVWGYVSILFTPDAGILFNVLIALLILAGAILVAFTAPGEAAAFARVSLISMALLLVAGAISLAVDIWRGPSPLYFELFLWPAYFVYAAETVRVGLGGVMRWVRRTHANEQRSASLRSLLRSVPRYGALAIMPWLLLLSLHLGRSPTKRNYQYPPRATTMVDDLRNEIGLVAGETFRGRVATLTGQRLDRPIGWLDLHQLDFRLVETFGNDHRSIGLWYFNVPTLFEYSPLLSPAAYVIAREFLTEPGDSQLRNVLTIRRFAPRLLETLGVRFVIVDRRIPAGAILRRRLEGAPFGELLLYELADANLGHFSPTTTVAAKDARAMLNTLTGREFDFRKTVVAERSLGLDLVPARMSSVRTDIGRLRVSATSNGTSVLLLPFEFSHCLTLEDPSAQAGPFPRLFRANLLQTGLVFEGRLNVTLRYFSGPFHNSSCRLADAADMDRLNLWGLARTGKDG